MLTLLVCFGYCWPVDAKEAFDSAVMHTLPDEA